jgi:hypothetical protein
MSQESLNRAVRTTRRTRTLGPDARCSRCGCADPTMLVQPPPPTPNSTAKPPSSPASNSATGRRSTISPRPPASKPSKKRILCYECLLIQQGKATTEAHHLLGKANDATTTIPAPGNQHRVQSDRQREWPEEVRNNRHRDPLLELAGWCLSLKDHLACWVERLGHVATWLVRLRQALLDHFGTPTWWIPLGVPPLSGELGT